VRVDRGEELIKSTLEAVRLRLRPIIMTSLAFILGVLPLAFATGAGAAARNTIGFTVSRRYAGSLYACRIDCSGAVRNNYQILLRQKEACLFAGPS